MPAIILTGQNIVLHPLSKADIENRVRWFNDPRIRKTLIISEQFELDKTTRWFEKMRTDSSRAEFVIETIDKIPIGIIGLSSIDSTHRTAEIYIVIGEKDFWGKGVMLEAESLLIDWAFNSVGLEKIWAEARPENVASLITMKKLGFNVEGTLRSEKIVDGARIDVLRLGLLKSDFSKKTAN
jgi:RimJ/RimL family protein N-acetyltransferase